MSFKQLSKYQFLVSYQRSAQCVKRSRRTKPSKEVVHCRGRKAFKSKVIVKNDLDSLEKNSAMFYVKRWLEKKFMNHMMVVIILKCWSQPIETTIVALSKCFKKCSCKFNLYAHFKFRHNRWKDFTWTERTKEFDCKSDLMQHTKRFHESKQKT